MTDIVSITQEFISNPSVQEAAAKGIATTIGKVLAEAGIKLLGYTNSKLLDGAGNLSKAAQNLLFPISRKYIANYTERHGTLKVLGMGKPVGLDSVYTKVNFQADTIRSYQSLEDLEQVFRQREKRDKKKLPGLDVANEEEYLMVLGNPGTGKTTFLRKVGLEALKGKGKGEYKHNSIPVLLELRRFRSGEINLVQAIASEFQNCGLPEYQDCTEKLLEKGRLLILLDGLDEVPSDRLNEMTTQIRDLLDRYSDNRFIVSCRIAAYRNFDNFRRFTDVAIADFDDEQIETFISKWFESHSQQEWGQQCWEKLNSGDRNATKELTRTPLLLAFLCILFKEKVEFPDKRATVYKGAFYILLSKWDNSKQIERFLPYKEMNTKCRETLLAKIAYDNFLVDNLFFQEEEISQQIEDILGKMLPDEQFINGRDILQAIEEQHGVLISRTYDIYSFSHLTLQEFLTAKHIIDDSLKIEELVDNHLCDRRWREVFLILAGLKRADDLLLKMEKAIHFLADTPKLQNLLTWVERVTDNSAGEFQPVGKRAIALCLTKDLASSSNKKYHVNLAYTLSKKNNHAFKLANFFVKSAADAKNLVQPFNLVQEYLRHITVVIESLIDYAQKSQKFRIYSNVSLPALITALNHLKEQIPDEQETEEGHQAFNQQMTQTWLEAFHLTLEMVDLSESEIEALDNYFYANLLMVECKKSAVQVLPETWSGIESRMLLPVRN